MKKAIYFYMLALVALWLPAGCDFLEIPAPKDQLVRGNVYTSDQSATAVVSGIYNGLIDASGQLGNLGIAAELCADQLVYAGNDNGLMQFFENSIDETNGYIQNLWTAFYRNIYRCNAALEGLADAGEISPPLQSRLVGEVLAIRAFCYFYLTNLWGDVPLVTHTDYRTNQRVGRTPAANVREAILADLLKADELLSGDYPSADRARINRSAVQGLLARVYWVSSDWQRAEAAASAVIDDPAYVLEAPAATFSLGSRETIWQLLPYNFPAQAPTYIPGRQDIIPTFYLAPDGVGAFPAGDERRREWMAANMVGEVEYTYPHKYKVAAGNNPVMEGLVVLRLAESYLIRAEARAMLGDDEGALADLNAVRQRAGLDGLDVQEEALLQAIGAERRSEFFTEWGLRWLDLKRSGTIDEVLTAVKPGWQPTDAWWPLPLNERQRNPELVPQNDGY